MRRRPPSRREQDGRRADILFLGYCVQQRRATASLPVTDLSAVTFQTFTVLRDGLIYCVG